MTSTKCNVTFPFFSGEKCDSCSHAFAELTEAGCQVVYGSCPAQYNSDILWPRTTFGTVANASCPSGAVGVASRACLGPKKGWGLPDLSGCLHKEFVLFNQLIKNKTSVKESWVLAKKARQLIDMTMHKGPAIRGKRYHNVTVRSGH